jgi:predicted O-methyltransferase YrrM
MPIRVLAATMDNTLLNLSKPRRFVEFSKALLKFPVEYSAAIAQRTVPAVTFTQLFGSAPDLNLAVEPSSLDRHGWNVKLHEEVYISAAVQTLKPLRTFEIGTFDGNTTRRLAEAAPVDARVFTLDLPEDMFDATQGPEAFSGSRVGERFRESCARDKITQIRADATSFDFSPYHCNIDFVFVDAAHDYPHGLADSRSALKMVRPGGTIIWHDFEPYWSGLVHAIREATASLPLKRLAGTSMAVLRMPTN